VNLFFKELISYHKGLFFWCLGIIALVGSGMAKYTALKGNGKTVIELMSQFPQSVQTILGLTGFDLTKASGYYGVLFMYIALMLTIHAVLLGAGIISKEERDKTSEFLFVKPISRSKILTSKILAGLSNVVILNIITLIFSIYFFGYFANGETFMNDILILTSGLLFLQVIFFFIGTMVAGVSKKPKLSATIATSVLLLTFVMTFFININESFNWLKYFTPFKYFDAKDLMSNGGLDPLYVLITLILIIIMVVVTYVSYNARDLDI